MVVKLHKMDQVNSSKEHNHLKSGLFIVSICGNEKDVYSIADETGVAWRSRPAYGHEQDVVEAIFTLYDEQSARELVYKISELYKGLSVARLSLAAAIKNCEV